MAKTVAAFRRRMTNFGFEAVRRPGVMFLHTMRKIPVMRNRVIPALLKEELDGIPVTSPIRTIIDRLTHDGDISRLQAYCLVPAVGAINVVEWLRRRSDALVVLAR